MALIPITGGGALTRKNIADLNANFSLLAGALTPGNILYCTPSSSYLGTPDGTAYAPFTDLPTAYGYLRNGKNDVLVLVGNGAASGSARLSGTLTWAKDAAHLIGIDSGVNVSNRARIAPLAGVTAFANFFTLSGNGCRLQNVQLFDGFSTGTTSQIALTVTGGRNYVGDCHIAGMGDNESAQSTGSRSLKISGTGENVFQNCTIGLDTITRTVANATLEFASGTPRNQFLHCNFPFLTSSATVLGFLGTGAACMDRDQVFDNCTFINQVQSTSTTMSGLGTLTSASAGGLLLFKQSVLVGITEYGTDATTRGLCYIDGLTGAAATSGIAVNPT